MKKIIPIREGHVIAGLQKDLNNSGAFYVHFLASSSVASGHSASLVETMRLHSACIVRDKHLQNNWLTHTLQLGTKKKINIWFEINISTNISQQIINCLKVQSSLSWE